MNYEDKANFILNRVAGHHAAKRNYHDLQNEIIETLKAWEEASEKGEVMFKFDDPRCRENSDYPDFFRRRECAEKRAEWNDPPIKIICVRVTPEPDLERFEAKKDLKGNWFVSDSGAEIVTFWSVGNNIQAEAEAHAAKLNAREKDSHA